MRIALVGNCQVQTYRVLLNGVLESPDVVSLDFSEKDSRDAVTLENFSSKASKAEIVLVMPNNILPYETLKTSSSGTVFRIANFYFRGLHPEACYVGTFEERVSEPSDYHSVIVLDAFRRNLSIEQCGKMFYPENLTRLGLFSAWESSLAELTARDEAVDLPGSPIVSELSRRFPTFLTINHPSIRLLQLYLEAVLKKLSVRYEAYRTLGVSDPLARHDQIPIMDEVAEFHRLQYRTTQRWKINSLGGRFVSREEMIALWYQKYSYTLREKLLVHSPGDLKHYLTSQPDLSFLIR